MLVPENTSKESKLKMTALIIQKNLTAWNEIAHKHYALNRDIIENNLKTSGFYIDSVLKDELQKKDVSQLTVGQFNCNNGREIISAHQLGYKRAIGFDFSSNFIQQGRDYAAYAETATEFVETNIYEIDKEYFGTVDHLFVTAGALCWMPDLKSYFEIAFETCANNGSITLWETHPMLEMFKPDRDRIRDGDQDLRMHYPYFMSEPVHYESGLDYYSNKKFGQEAVLWYHHKLSDIVQAVINAGFRIVFFKEYDYDNSIGYREVESFAVRPPMSFILTAHKDAARGKIALRPDR